MMSLMDKKEWIRQWLEGRDVGQAFQPAIHYPFLRRFTSADLRSMAARGRRLPHWEMPGSTYFVTFRVNGSDGGLLHLPKLAYTVEEAIWFGFPERYSLNGYVIMPDHVHLLLIPLSDWTLPGILQGIKEFTSREINKALGRRGVFWQDENFDHIIRHEQDWMDKLEYIHHNPVRAGIVERAQDYPFSSLVTLYSYGRLESLPHDLQRAFFCPSQREIRSARKNTRYQCRR